jgi:hypothetical protein
MRCVWGSGGPSPSLDGPLRLRRPPRADLLSHTQRGANPPVINALFAERVVPTPGFVWGVGGIRD